MNILQTSQTRRCLPQRFGGQHACLVADALGIKTVLIHPLSGVLSAFGIGLGSLQATRSWYGSVLRGDNEWIEIGARSQIQR